jgi:hypothetical protein
MPKIKGINYKGYRFFFYSNEGDPREPLHVHIRKGEKLAKFWVRPFVSLASAFGMNSAEVSELERVVLENQEIIAEAWHEHFGDDGNGDEGVV